MLSFEHRSGAGTLASMHPRLGALVLAFNLCAATALAADTWATPFPGVRHLHRTGASNLNLHAAVVDLCAPGVSVRHTAFDERAQRTSAFGTSVGAQLAMNADFSCRPIDVGPNSPFPPCVGKPAYTTYGISAHAGTPWPHTLSLDAMLAFGADRVQLFDDAEDQPFQPWMQEVLSGHWSLVRDGQLLSNDCPIDPRTGIGLSKDHRTLLMAVADGRNGWRGLTCLEMGQLLIELGADRAFALDSGGSTTMWMAGQGVLNHPSDGSERVVGSHLAVFAKGSGRPPFCEEPPIHLDPAAPLPPVTRVGPQGRFTPVSPVRLFDTRSAAQSSALLGLVRDAAGRVAAGSTFSFSSFAGFAVPADATAVSVNLTAADAEGPGFATAFPAQLPRPLSSTVNFPAAQATGNSALVALGSAGAISVFTFAAAQLIGDLQGYFGPQGAGFVPQTPQRLLDTRGGAMLEPNVPRVIAPPQSNNPVALALSVVATGGSQGGFLTVFPCGEATPFASTLNFGAAQPTAAFTTAKLGPQGICAVSMVATHLVVDAMGAFVAGAGLEYQPLAPARLVDTRSPAGRWQGRTPRATPLELAVAQAPGFPEGARAVALNLTVTDPLDDGFAAVYPCDAGFTNTSNLNYRYGQTVASAALVGLGSGKLCLWSLGRAHVVIDLLGAFVGAPQPPLSLDPVQPGQTQPGPPASPPAASFEPPPSAGAAGPAPTPVAGSCAAAPGLPALVWAALALALRRRPRGARRPVDDALRPG